MVFLHTIFLCTLVISLSVKIMQQKFVYICLHRSVPNTFVLVLYIQLDIDRGTGI